MENRAQTQRAVADLEKQLRERAHGAAAGRAYVQDGVIEVMNDMLKSAEQLGKGRILTDVLRLNFGWQATCLEYLNGSIPYDGMGPNLRVKIRAKAPIKLLVSTKFHPYIADDGTPKDTGWTEEKYYPEEGLMKAGEVVELPARAAVQALTNFCRTARQPAFWDKGGQDVVEVRSGGGIGVKKADYVEEVGYSCTIDGENFSCDLTKRQRIK